MASGLNNGTRLFRGCRTLLDSLKSTTQAYSSAAAVSPKGKLKASGAAASRKNSEAGEKKEVNRSGGIFKSVQVSPALAGFLGMSESSRPEAVKQIWSYIKLNNLQVLFISLVFADMDFFFFFFLYCCSSSLFPAACSFASLISPSFC